MSEDKGGRRPAAPRPLPFYGFLMWVTSLVPHTRRPGGLKETDLPALPACLGSKRQAAAAESEWVRRCTGKRRLSIIWIIFHLNRFNVAQNLIWGTCMALLQCLGRPVAVGLMVRAAQAQKQPGDTVLELVVVALVIFCEGLAWMFSRHACCDIIGTSTMASISGLIMSKATTVMDSSALSDEKVMVAVDTIGKVNSAFSILSFLVSNALGLVIGTLFALWTIGLSALAGLAFALAGMYINHERGRAASVWEKQAIQKSDQRMKILNEILANIKGVKIHAWEQQFMSQMSEVRALETKHYSHWHKVRSVGVNLGRSLPVLCSCVVFCLYAATGGELSAEVIFPTLAVFQGMRMPMVLLPMNIVYLQSFSISMQRVEAFLHAPNAPSRQCLPPTDVVALMDDVCVSYSTEGARVLSGVTLRVRSGRLLGIVGAVASGKSTLLLALLGELALGRGRVAIAESVGFAPQRPVVISGTLAENILSGRSSDEVRLGEVLRACCLVDDLAALVNGLETEIGERGVTLSGGQQQRLGLARALYSAPALLVLDDPLSAVDVHTGARLMASIVEAARSGAGVIASLNQPHELGRCDEVLLLGDGRTLSQGTPEEVFDAAPAGMTSQTQEYFQLLGEAVRSRPIDVDSVIAQDEVTLEDAKVSADVGQGNAFKLVKEDRRQEGSMKLRVYKDYIQSVGSGRIVGVLCLFLASHLSYAANDLWLMRWTQGNMDLGTGIGGLVCFTMLYALGASAAAQAWYNAAALGGRQIFHDCMQAVLGAPLGWFDETPSGRVTSRFSGDLQGIDVMFAQMSEALMQFVFLELAIFSMSIYVNPFFIVVATVYLCAMGAVVYTVGAVNRDTKRMGNIALSPVLTNISELRLCRRSGLLRPMGLQQFFSDRHHRFMEAYCRAFFVSQTVQTWGNFACYGLSALMSVASAYTVLATNRSPEAAGLQIVYCFILPFTMNLSVMLFFMTVVGLTQLERLFELKMTPQEQGKYMEVTEEKWPQDGALSFRGASMKYKAGLPYALQDVNLDIPAGSRVGICGRTGSGKSSLLVMMLRLVELDKGSVHLSGRCLASVGHAALRRAIAMIPQEPFLMAGTLHSNLDPFGEHSHDAVQTALARAGLQDHGLDHSVEAAGSNFSAGQRQMLSFARVLLRDAKVILLDEPTSSLDPVTDAKMGELIRGMAGSTVLTIAHRLGTIADSDLIMVLSAGQVVESAAPSQLLQNPDGQYAMMVQKASQECSQSLEIGYL